MSIESWWRCGANVHVFGHSHLPVDASIDGVRYLQYALGYPRDWGRCEEPPAIWNLQEDANERDTDIQAPLPSADTAPLRSSSANAHAAPYAEHGSLMLITYAMDNNRFGSANCKLMTTPRI